jgi:hypothetical protein
MTTPDNISVLTSDATFAATLKRLREAIAERGLTLFAEIDHAGNARAAGLEMPPFDRIDLRQRQGRHPADVEGTRHRP